MKKLRIACLSIFVLFYGCEKAFFGEDIANTPLNNFEIFWNDFNRFYPFFEIKQVNWDSIYSVYKPQVTNQTTELELFTIFSAMIKPLKDGHVLLNSNKGKVFSYPMEIFDDYYSDSRINPQNYLESFMVNSRNINYFDVLDHNIGYISINTFNIKGETFVFADESFEIIDDILVYFEDKDGIIIDIRWNGGGFQPNFETIASRFTDKKRHFAMVRSKNGPGKTDFSEWVNWYIQPEGLTTFNKPVVVLTSRETGSASEWFTMAMKTLPNVTTVGDTTNGSFSPQLYRELPNGWSFALSTQQVVSAKGEIYEGTGIIPDSTVINTTSHLEMRIDAILEAGIEIIHAQTER